MKVTIFKPKRKRETMTNMEIEQVVEELRTGKYEDEVREVRDVFPLIHPRLTDDGRMVSDIEFRMRLPRLCFAGELKKRRKEEALMTYNGLLVLEANNLESYEEAARLRNEAARLPQTLLAFVGCSGRSVKIVCRGMLLDSQWQLPGSIEDMEMLKSNISIVKSTPASGALNIPAIAPAAPQPSNTVICLYEQCI